MWELILKCIPDHSLTRCIIIIGSCFLEDRFQFNIEFLEMFKFPIEILRINKPQVSQEPRIIAAGVGDERGQSAVGCVDAGGRGVRGRPERLQGGGGLV